MSPAPVTILKLGGSLITNKDRPCTPNLAGIRSVARALRRTELLGKPQRIILVHGGGSYGHFYANRFGLGVKPIHSTPRAYSETLTSMLELHSLILGVFKDSGIPCATLLSTELLSEHSLKLSGEGRRRLLRCLQSNLVPISFGNVVLGRDGTYIISGDTIIQSIAEGMQAKKVIFAMDVDGIYSEPALRGKVIPVITSESDIETSIREFDVTGGIETKLRCGLSLSRQGVEVFFVNGSKSLRLEKLLGGSEDLIMTKICAFRKAKETAKSTKLWA